MLASALGELLGFVLEFESFVGLPQCGVSGREVVVRIALPIAITYLLGDGEVFLKVPEGFLALPKCEVDFADIAKVRALPLAVSPLLDDGEGF